MTDEERQQLCAVLRRRAELGPARVPICGEAADEIERLAVDVGHWKMIANRVYIDPKPLAQSDAKPVAELIKWQYRVKQSDWSEWYDAAPTKAEALSYIESLQRFGLVGEYELRPLYTAPPRLAHLRS